MQNDVKTLGYVYDVCEKIRANNAALDAKGVVLGIDTVGNKIILHVEQFGIIIYVRPFHKQMEQLYTFAVSDNSMQITSSTNTVSIGTNEVLDIKLVVSIKQNRIKDKFIVKIVKLDEFDKMT
jgi:hypothetical protein